MYEDFSWPTCFFQARGPKMENEFCCWKYYLGLFMCKLFHHISPKTISKRRVRILSIIGEFRHFWADDDWLSDVLGFLKSQVSGRQTYFESNSWPISLSGPQSQFCRFLMQLWTLSCFCYCFHMRFSRVISWVYRPVILVY